MVFGGGLLVVLHETERSMRFQHVCQAHAHRNTGVFEEPVDLLIHGPRQNSKSVVFDLRREIVSSISTKTG